MIKLLSILITGLGTQNMQVSESIYHYDFETIKGCEIVGETVIKHDMRKILPDLHRVKHFIICYDTEVLESQNIYQINSYH